MKPIISIAVILFSLSYSAHAYTPADSIGVYRDNTNIYILHEVTKGETLYSLSKKYNVRVDLIISANPAIKDFSIAEGQIVKVPVDNIAKTNAPEPQVVQQKEQPKNSTQNDSTIRHEIQPGETLSAIASKYRVKMSEIAEWNNLQSFDNIRAGQIILIKQQPNIVITQEPVKKEPAPRQEEQKVQVYNPEPVVEKKPEVNVRTEKPVTNNGNIYHTVELGETLYSISKRYDVRVSDVANWNNLTNLEIRAGQQLVIKKDSGSQSRVEVAEAKDKESNTMIFEDFGNEKPQQRQVRNEPKPEVDVRRENNYSLKYKEDASSMYYKERAETGIATWIKDASPQATKNGYFALHKTLPVGTIVKVKNPMNGRVVYAKVIGNLPDNQDNRNILIKLPESAAREMAILDERMNVDVIFLARAKEN